MAEDDDEVGAFGPERGGMGGDGLDDAAGGEAALQQVGIPEQRLRRRGGDEADPERVAAAVGAGQLAGQDRPRRGEGAVVERRGAGFAHQIGAEHREARPGEGGLERREAEVEVVVAEGGGVVAERGHRRDHRVRVVAGGFHREVGKRRALQHVARIDEERGRGPGFGPGGADHRAEGGEAARFGRLAGAPGIRRHRAMEVGGAEDAQAAGPGARGNVCDVGDGGPR